LLKIVRIIVSTISMYLVTHLFVFVVLPFAILISYIDKEKIPVLKQWFARSLFAIVGKELIVSGYDHVNPSRAYVIISNYPSFYAGFSMIGVFPRARIVAHAFIKNIPLLGQLLRRLGTVFVHPGKAGEGKKAIDMGLSDEDGIVSVIIFPEGERTPDGEIHRFRRGFIYFLRQTSLDLLPVTLNGFYQLKPLKRFYMDPDAQPELIIHAPITNAAARKMNDQELMAKVRTTIGSIYRP